MWWRLGGEGRGLCLCACRGERGAETGRRGREVSTCPQRHGLPLRVACACRGCVFSLVFVRFSVRSLGFGLRRAPRASACRGVALSSAVHRSVGWRVEGSEAARARERGWTARVRRTCATRNAHGNGPSGGDGRMENVSEANVFVRRRVIFAATSAMRWWLFHCGSALRRTR